MLTIYSDKHRLRDSQTELCGGVLVPPFECPKRMDYILTRLREKDFNDIHPPREFGLAPVQRIHDSDYLDFLANCWREWQDAGFAGEVIASNWPARRMRQKPPTHIDGKVGYYALAAETAIDAGAWEAACASADVALTAAAEVTDGQSAAFAMCRPPGHHAAVDMYGGYCFINNAAVAAQYCLDNGAKRVAVLDVDFHHGNGTQDIFYRRGDVLFVSLHGRPEDAFPFFLGYEDEIGEGEGEGFNANYPMPPGTPFSVWGEALQSALQRIAKHAPDILVVSFGADTFKEDPISFFKLESDDFYTMGERIAELKAPTIFVMEGGYAVEALGVNTVNLLSGFAGRR